jgi:succinoglycan biosynthesis transport protein ExoP
MTRTPPQHPLIVQSSSHSHRSEAFRRLRTNPQFLDIADRPKTIAVTSSLPGEGKSTRAADQRIRHRAPRHPFPAPGDGRR